MEEKIEFYENESNSQDVHSEITISNNLLPFTLIAVIANIIGLWVISVFQGIDSGCGSRCLSTGSFVLIFIYYVSVAGSLVFVKKNPISVGMWIWASSFASLIFSLIFAIPSFIILFYFGAKLLEQSWKKVEKTEKTRQMLIGSLLVIFTLFLAGFRLLQML